MKSEEIGGLIFIISMIAFCVIVITDGMLMTPYHDEIGTITSITNNGEYYTYTLQCNGTISIQSVNYYNMSDQLLVSLQRTGITRLPISNVFVKGIANGSLTGCEL